MVADLLIDVDFRDSDQSQRHAFAAAIYAAGWLNHPSKPNAFYKPFRRREFNDELVSLGEAEMKRAATQVGLCGWKAIIIFGEPGWRSAASCKMAG